LNNILLTGGAGFIGSHIAVNLITKGYKVSILDSYINSKRTSINRIRNLIKKQCPDFLSNLTIYEGDLRDLNFVKNIFDQQNDRGNMFDGVIHLAGLKAVGVSVNYPIEYWECNVSSTLNLLKVMNQNECRKIIFSSSATIYNQTKNEKIDENCTIKPINPYGSTKAAVEQILLELFNSSSKLWNIINLRYFNPIGAHPSGLIGEEPQGKPNNIFPIILNVAADNTKILKIYGSDWSTYDGTGVRDYIHIIDLAEGHLRAFEFLMKNKGVYLNLNLGTGIGTSVLDLVKIFEKSNNIKIPFSFIERRKGDVGFTVADNSLAKEILKWVPEKTISEMCIDGWRWKKNLKNYK
tara:strand:- start:156 stop:1208 length:1053 start_codon:yes stop_codon:yes gene_type:complete